MTERKRRAVKEKRQNRSSPAGEVGKLKAKVVRHPTRGTVQRLTDFSSPPLVGNLKAAARSFVRRLASDLGVSEKHLVFDKIVESPLGKHILFQQHIAKAPVSGAWLKLDIDKERRVYQITNNCLPPESAKHPVATEIPTAKKDLSAEDAIERAIERLGVDRAALRGEPTTEAVMLPSDDHAEPAWKILIASGRPLADYRVYVSRDSGKILKKDDLLKMATIKALVFDPNPVVTLNDHSLGQRSKLPDEAYRNVELLDVKPTGHLDGPFVTTAATRSRVVVKNGVLTAKRGTSAFKEAMVYFHIDRTQRYLKSLGFSDINSSPVSVDVSGPVDDNSFYSPNTKSLSFGTGGVDDAEDAEVILHEYGHAIQDAQNPGFGAEGGEARAMGEGFGDYLAASFFEELKPSHLRHLVCSWDAVAYSDQDPPYLRRLDSTKVYRRDLVGEEHADGEIWSACLWQIREHLGRQRSDRLIISHHYLVARNATFKEAAEAMLRAEQQLHQGAYAKAITSVFVRRGIFLSRKKRQYNPNALSNHPRDPI